MIILNESNTKSSKSKRKYRCPYCEDVRLPKEKLIDHIDDKHEDMIPQGYTAARIVFNKINKKEVGHCVQCKKETKWNEDTWKYERFCSKKCSDEYSKQMKQRMINVYGKEHLLNDPEKQTEMLKHRSISGTYKFKDGGRKDYCGSYERKLLEFFDNVLNVNSNDIMTPGPTIEYEYNGNKLFWITDLYYTPYNLVFDVKDGGDNPNNRDMPEYRAKQEAKENTIKQMNKYNYIRLTNNNFQQLLLLLAELKQNLLEEDNPEYIVRINEGFVPATGPESGFINNIMINNVFVGSYFAKDELDKYWYTTSDKKLIKIERKDIPMGECHIFKYKEDCSWFNKIIEENLNQEVEFDNNYFYEMLTGKHMLTPDQIIFDENFEEVNSCYYNESLLILEASIYAFNDPSIPILDFDLQKQFKDKYSNLELRKNWNGYFAENVNTKNVTPYVEDISDLDESLLITLDNF